MLIEQGMDSNLISQVFEKLGESNNEQQQVVLDEESLWFETQFT